MKSALKLLTAITKTDSYKLSQWEQYPEGTTHISSYVESRGGEEESVFFGLQAFIKDYMLEPITMSDVDMAEQLVTAHGYSFNRKGWEIIVNEYGGYLPLEIESVPEGTVMSTRNVQVQVVNTDPRLFWLTSYIETALLRAIWYPSTVATKSRKMKKLISASLAKTSDIPVADQIMFKLHDFGARGASSSETAVLGGMAHLTNFLGSDTFEAVVAMNAYYGGGLVAGYSIPASEHSTITSWGRENEAKAFENMIDKFAKPGSIYACVSDSYDLWKACSELWPSLKDKIIATGGKLVVRPDSGDPTIVPIQVIQILMEKFGYTVNSKGFKVLPSYIGVIQGDGINEESLPKIIENMEAASLSLENLAFGMGGGLLQAWNRDSLRYAMKASAIRINEGPWTGFSKDPITDHGKKSKEGRLGLINVCGVGSCDHFTVPENVANEKGNLLRTVYRNGVLLINDDIDAIRQRAALKESEYKQTTVERY